MTISAQLWLENSILQSVAESYLDWSVDLEGPLSLDFVLDKGVNHPDLNAGGKGATRLTSAQIEWFKANYDIITHYPNDSSGFSATLFRNKNSGEYTLSFRSTEYQYSDLGGDWERDGADGADGMLKSDGFALAQLSSMENLYRHLKNGEIFNNVDRVWEWNADVAAAFSGNTPPLNVTGYSLGGHMATAFTLMHQEDVQQTYTFNSAGLGGIDGGAPEGWEIAGLVSLYDEMMAWDGQGTPSWLFSLPDEAIPEINRYIVVAKGSPGEPQGENVYLTPKHQEVMNVLRYGMDNVLGIGIQQLGEMVDNWMNSSGDGPLGKDPNAFTSSIGEVDHGAWTKIQQIYGHGEFFDPQFVANNGYHAADPTPIWIEDLPTSRGLGFFEMVNDSQALRDFVGDFGETHSISPLIDSLTVIDLLQGLDSSFDSTRFRGIMKAMSNRVDVIDSSLFHFPGSTVITAMSSFVSAAAQSVLEKYINTDRLYDADAMERFVNELAGIFTGVKGALVPASSSDGYVSPLGYANIDSRNALHQAIEAIRGSRAYGTAAGNVSLVSLVGLSADEIVQLAEADVGYRYSLVEMLPFAVAGAGSNELYAGTFNANGELNVYDPSTEAGELSVSYLHDRASMLVWKIQYDYGHRDDDDLPLDLADKQYIKQWDIWGSGEDWTYIDRTQLVGGGPLTLTIDALDWSLADPHHVIFGSDANANGDSTLTGGDSADHIYGGGGDDLLLGNDGDDHLEGNAGIDTLVGGQGSDTLLGGKDYDTYKFQSAHFSSYGGFDVIYDSDGQGGILYNGALLPNGVNVAPNVYQSAAGAFTYILTTPGSLELSNDAGGSDKPGLLIVTPDGSIYVNDYHKETGELSITLTDPAPPGGTELYLTADLPSYPDYTSSTPPNTIHGSEVANNIQLWGWPGSGDLRVFGGGGDDVVNSDIQAFQDIKDGLATPPDPLTPGIILYGDAGYDRLFGSTRADILIGGSGTDVLYGEYGSDVISGGTEQDWVDGADDDDFLRGGDGNDYLMGGDGIDSLSGGGGDDHLYGDTYTRGNPVFVGGSLAWTALDLIAPIDYLPDTPELDWFQLIDAEAASAGADLLDGGAGNDRLYGGGGNDTLLGGGDNDHLFGEGGDDYLEGGSGNDRLWGDIWDEEYALQTAIETTYIDAFGQTVAVHWRLNGDAADVAGNDTLYGDSGDDQLYGGSGDDRLFGGTESDHLYGGDGDDHLFGEAGVDQLHGGDGSDQLDGGGDNDHLYGEAGNDTLSLSAGTDTLDGGAGDDTYRIQAGWEGGFISDESGNDTVAFGTGISPAELKVQRAGSDLLLSHTTTGGTLVFQGWFGAGGAYIEQFTFADGTTWTPEWVTQESARQEGSDGADTLYGGDGVDDILVGNGGDDALIAAGGIDRLEGGAGNDTLDGGTGADTLDGGAGNDVMTGGDGGDLYITGLGSDSLFDRGSDAAVNTVRLATGTALTGLSRSGNDLTLITDGGETLISGYYLSPASWQFEDAEANPLGIGEAVITPQSDAAFVQGFRDSFLTHEQAHMAALAAAEERFRNQQGNDDFSRDIALGVFQAASSSASGIDAATGHLSFIAQQDAGGVHVYSSPGFFGDSWSESYYSNGSLGGSGGGGSAGGGGLMNHPPVFREAIGVTVVHISAPESSYRYDPVIDDFVWVNRYVSLPQVEETPHATVTQGVNPEVTTRYSDVLIANVTGSEGNDEFGPDMSTLFEPDPPRAVQLISALGGDDLVNGFDSADFLSGGEGDDRLYGMDGDDILVGGNGSDLLEGGAGNDFYLFEHDLRGVDLIWDDRNYAESVMMDASGTKTSGNDTVRINADFSEIALYTFDYGDHPALLLTWDGGSDRTGIISVLNNGLESADFGIENYQFNDAAYTEAELTALAATAGDPGLAIPFVMRTPSLPYFLSARPRDSEYWWPMAGEEVLGTAFADVIDLAAFSSFAPDPFVAALHGGAGDDEMRGDFNDNLLFGGEGDDTLYGGAGFDLLHGGGGNNILYGGAGDDELIANAGSSRLYGEGGNDSLYLGPQEWLGNGESVSGLLDGGDGSDNLQAEAWENGSGSRVASELLGGAGDDWLDVDTSFNLAGARIENTLRGGTGNDALASYSEGNEAGALISNLMQGGEGDDTLLAEGMDAARIGSLLDGGAGFDELTAGGGDEILIGGTGDDYLMAGAESGADILLFNRGDGNDTLDNLGALSDSTQVISLGGGITPADLVLRKEGMDLVLDTGSGETIRLLGWYGEAVDFRPVITLQVIGGQIELYDFGTLVDAFDLALAADPGLPGWGLSSGLAAAHIATHGDRAFGGDIAYQYGRYGDYATMNEAAIHALLSDPETGHVPQLISQAALWNNAPQVANGIADQTAAEDAPFGFTLPGGTFSDMDAGDILTLSATLADGSPLPVWLSFDAASGTFSGLPGNSDVGTLSLKATAVDSGGLSVSDTFDLTVENVNDAPTVSLPAGDQTAVENALFSFTLPAGTFDDVDGGDTLTLSATLEDGSPLPAWLSFDAVSGAFSGTPAYSDVGLLSLKVTATDAAVSDTFTLQVQERPLNVIAGTAGDDTVTGTDGDDAITGGAGSDLLDGGAGDDVFLVAPGDGYDTVNGGEGTDRIQGGGGDDVIGLQGDFGAANGIEVIDGGGGHNAVAGSPSANVLDFSGVVLANIAEIRGGEGDDTVTGTAGNDVIAGGMGSDLLDGGAGDDIFLVAPGDGYDTVNGGEGVDLILGGEGDDVIGIQGDFGAGNSVEVISGGGGYNVIEGSPYANVLDFSSTVLINIAEIRGGDERDTLTGTAGNDLLDGGEGHDNLSGGDGEDSLYGGGGSDKLYGGGGADYLAGGAGHDRLEGGEGADTLSGDNGYDTLYGHEGDDVLYGGYGLDSIIGGKGDDLYDGGPGNDFLLDTDGGSDTYLFGKGSGGERITEVEGSSTEVDKIIITGGVTPDEVTARREYYNIVLEINGGSDQLTVLHWFIDPSRRVERVEFEDGTVWDSETLIGFAQAAVATEGDDTLTGTEQADTINGLGGTDYIFAMGGDDILFGGEGDDRIYGYDGADVLAGEGGDDYLAGGEGDNSLSGGSGSDRLMGGTGSDVMDGGSGNDELWGFSGSDTYLFGRGSGQDSIVELPPILWYGTGEDSLLFGEEISRDQLWFSRRDDDLEVTIIGTDDRAVLEDWYRFPFDGPMERFQTADGALLLNTQVEQLVSAMAAFSPPASGQLTLPDEMRSALEPVIAAAWQ